MEIHHYRDFVDNLLACGFSLGGGRNEGIFALIDWDWQSPPPYDTPVRWHTGDPETDPWEWRMRVLAERDDIAYGKVFFKKSGYITRAWYPRFLAVRRGGQSFADAYGEGRMSHAAKRIYQVVAAAGALSVPEIKRQAGFAPAEKSPFERALTELQMGLYLTVCGRQQKRSQAGETYGWPATAFCTTEQFWGEAVFAQAAALDPQEAAAQIAAQVRRLNPAAPPKKIEKFIGR